MLLGSAVQTLHMMKTMCQDYFSDLCSPQRNTCKRQTVQLQVNSDMPNHRSQQHRKLQQSCQTSFKVCIPTPRCPKRSYSDITPQYCSIIETDLPFIFLSISQSQTCRFPSVFLLLLSEITHFLVTESLICQDFFKLISHRSILIVQ